MQMPGQARTGYSAQIQPNIETFRVQSFAVDNGQLREQINAFDIFLPRQIFQITGVPQRRDKKVAIVVGIPIQNDERSLAARDDHQLPFRR